MIHSGNLVNEDLRDQTDEMTDEVRASRRTDKIKEELLFIAEAEFAKHDALRQQLADLATLVGTPAYFYMRENDMNTPWGADSVPHEYLKTPLFVDEDASSEEVSVGYYINSWESAGYAELRVVTNDKEELESDSQHQSNGVKDMILVSIGGTTSEEFSNDAGDSAVFSGVVFEAPTAPVDGAKPFMEHDERVMVQSDSPAFTEIRELIRRMSQYYRHEHLQETKD